MALESLSLEELDGKYEILRKLREGGMGAIYKVRHRLLDEVRVIKVIHPQHEGDEGLQRRFHREAKTAIRLRHPNIAQLYDFSINDEGSAYIVMEFIEGITFQEMLGKGTPPSLGLALEIAQQGLEAIGYLHQQGFVHRDISPDNLMIARGFDGGPLVKLIDLGIAKNLERGGDLTATGTFLGKVRYCAPEGFAGDSAKVTPQSDLYSYGMLVYELLTGRCPIDGENFSELVSGHLFRAPLDFAQTDPEGRIPEGVQQVVLRALAKEPDERVGSAKEFSAGLQEFCVEGVSWAAELEQRLQQTTDDSRDSTRIPAPGSTQDRLNRQFEMAAMSPAPATDPGALRAQDSRAKELDTEALGAKAPAARDPETSQTRGSSTSSGATGAERSIEARLANAELLAQLDQVDKARLELHHLLQLEPQHQQARALLASLGAPQDGRTEILPPPSKSTNTDEDVHALLQKAGLKGPEENVLRSVQEPSSGIDPEKTWIQHPSKAASRTPPSASTPPGASSDDRVGQAVAAVRSSLDSGQRDQALQQLELAVSLYGEDPRIEEIRKALDHPASPASGSTATSSTKTSPLRQAEKAPQKKGFSWLLWGTLVAVLLTLVLLAVMAR
ncbi:MAG: serine/threonine protein kinase [Deltaproteobacteria bacterium]|nr:serine/threonine protein kinase [Deltaproteobacteria bacterium]